MIKIVRLFVLSLALFACGDKKNKADQNFIDPQNKKNKAIVNEWNDTERRTRHNGCVEKGYPVEFCTCMLDSLPQKISFSSYIEIEEEEIVKNKEEQKIVESLLKKCAFNNSIKD